MSEPTTSLSLALLTLLSGAACVTAVRRLRRPPGEPQTVGGLQTSLVTLVGLGSAALFAYRWLMLTRQWQPLYAHLDGLLLIAVLFAALVMFIQSRPKLMGLSAFALPLLTLILAWAICASAWTYKPFNVQTPQIWTAVHLGGVYLGTFCAGAAAIAGGMFLYVQSRLKRKVDPGSFGRLASLETLEGIIIRAATLGFAMLTLGLASGLIMVSARPGLLIQTTWLWPKIVLAASAWVVYAVVMNVRYATTFRGARAAWMSIVGLVLILATYGLVSILPDHEIRTDSILLSWAMILDPWMNR